MGRRRAIWRCVVGVLAALLFGCVGRIGDGGPNRSSRAGASESGLTAPIRRLRRLSNREYNNVVRDLLGDTSQPANRFIPDVYPNGYDNGSAGLAVQSDQALAYEAAAESLAATAVSTNLAGLLGGCDVTQAGQQACLDAFLASFAPRAYRRPLTATEVQRLRDIFQIGAATAGGFGAGIQVALELILQSPEFLYREELGPIDAVPYAGATTSLTRYEAASELSFLLTGSIPDAELWAAVLAGQFESAADYAREAARLLASPAAKTALRAFMHQWLGTDRLAGLTKDPAFYPTFKASMAGSMSTELDMFFDQVLWQGQGSLRDLFTSNQSFADTTLGQLYGAPVTGPGFQPVTLDPVRKGVLGRAGYLAVHAATDSSGPIARGVFVLESMLCLPPPQPPANVPPAVPAGDPTVKNITTRQRFAQHVSSSFCAGCHQQIDGVGFGFEEFDGIGAYRTMENGQPVDSTGTIIGTGEIDGSYSGVPELAVKLAGSEHLVDCYVKQAYRFAMGQVEPATDDLKSVRASFSSDARVTDVLMNLVDSPLFTTRTFEAQSP
jgi:hypothetical protein